MEYRALRSLILRVFGVQVSETNTTNLVNFWLWNFSLKMYLYIFVYDIIEY